MQGDQGILTILKTIFPCLVTYTYIHTYHFVGPQMLSYDSQTWNLSAKAHNTKKQNEHNTIQ
jgi:hypothetical protein